MKRDDTLWKAILEDVFDDFLLFFFEEEAEMFDLEKGFVFLDKELEQLFPFGNNKKGVKFIDKLVKVFTKAGGEQWILVHIEVQGYDDKGFAKRMFTYFYRIYDRFEQPITSIAIFTDSNKNFRPSKFNYEFLGTQIIFRYNAYKVIDQDENELRRSNNPFAIVILTVLLALKKGEIAEEELLDLKTELFKSLLQKEIPHKKIRSLMIFLYNYIRFDNAEITRKFDHGINLITNTHTTMGIEQFILQRVKDDALEKGMEKGMEIKDKENKLRFVKSLLAETDFTTQKIARMADVTVAFVEDVRASLQKL